MGVRYLCFSVIQSHSLNSFFSSGVKSSSFTTRLLLLYLRSILVSGVILPRIISIDSQYLRITDNQY